MKVGIYNGTNPAAMKQTEHIESWIGPSLDVQNVFVPWDDAGYEIDDLFGRVLPTIIEAGRTPLITWEPYLTSRETPPDVLERVISGEYEAYLDNWATRLSDLIEQYNSDLEFTGVIVRLAHEANGNWYPWAPAGGDGTPEQYVEMWKYVGRYVEGRVDSSDYLAWMWAVNGDDVGPYGMADLYPGDDSVDWLGIDCYNWGESQDWSDWLSPEELFVPPIEQIRAFGGSSTPLAVSEFACSSLTETGYDERDKSKWIRRTFRLLDRYGIDMTVWFNEDKETDWAIFGGERGTTIVSIDGQQYDAYHAYAQQASKRL